MIQNRFQKRAEAKNRKSVKTNSSRTFLVHFAIRGGLKIQQNSLNRGLENEIKIKCDFEVDFSQIWEDLGAILGRKIVPKSEKKAMTKQSDFKTKLAARALFPKQSGKALWRICHARGTRPGELYNTP